MSTTEYEVPIGLEDYLEKAPYYEQERVILSYLSRQGNSPMLQKIVFAYFNKLSERNFNKPFYIWEGDIKILCSKQLEWNGK